MSQQLSKNLTLTLAALTILGFLFISPINIAPVNAAEASRDIKIDLQIPLPNPSKPTEPTTSLTLCSGSGNDFRCNGIADYIAKVYMWLLGTMAIVTVLIIMVAGLMWMTAAGNKSRIGNAKKLIANSLIGISTVFASYTILHAINPELITFKSLSLIQLENIKIEKQPEVQSSAPDYNIGTATGKKNQIFIHHSGGSDDAYCYRPAGVNGQLCNFWVLTTGEVKTCTPDNIDPSYCTWGANSDSVAIEISSVTGKKFTQRQIDAVAKLVSQLATKYNIPKTNNISSMNYNGHTGNPGGIFSHANVCEALHSDYASETRWDPPENIFKTILGKAGIPYTSGQPRCDSGGDAQIIP